MKMFLLDMYLGVGLRSWRIYIQLGRQCQAILQNTRPNLYCSWQNIVFQLLDILVSTQ